jgi:hypothetical protein
VSEPRVTFASDIASDLTKREYFAALALMGLLANRATNKDADDAVMYADALIDRLNAEAQKTVTDEPNEPLE